MTSRSRSPWLSLPSTLSLRGVATAFLAFAVLSVFAPALAHAAEPAAAAAAGSNSDAFANALKGGLLPAYALAFVSGLGLCLTPCVYPMIAITVSVFGGAAESRSKAKGAALSATFVLGMALLFTVLGVSFAMSGAVFGSFLANKFVVGAITLLFIVLASSMFGAFEMALPASLNNRLASVGGIGFGGAFVLGLVSALVAAPCTGPFMTGLLLWLSTTRDAVLGGSVMFVFALGLGLPFFLVGAFAVKLPKSGAWMLGVKWIFGVALAVFALRFLAPIVPALMKKIVSSSTTYLVAAIAVSIVGFVLASVHVAAERKKSPIAHLSKPMKLASIPFAVLGMFAVVSFIQLPKGELRWIDSEAQGAQMANSEKRPMIVDFGAEWCAACKELATHTFADSKVREEASRFVAVKIDATDDEDERINTVKSKYKVVGLPTVVVLDSDGHEKVRFNEFVPPERFLEAIRSVN
ncbi:MAG: cytochrome c biogenesis protein CcdA [Polyangiaceae bacterium]